MSLNTLNLLSFKIEDSNKKELTYVPIQKNKEIPVTLKCIVFVDNENIATMKEQNVNRIYLLTSTNNLYIAQQYVDIPVDELDGTNFIEASFSFKVPYMVETDIKVSAIDAVFAYSFKHTNDMDLGESLRQGKFLATTIPTSEVK